VKKSSAVTLTLMASMALASCRTRRCVDPVGNTVADSFCGGAVVLPGYHWVYTSGSRTYIGARSGSSSAPAQGVSRGGFGAHGEAGSGSHASSGAHGSAGGHAAS
jgi:hypothetical protein